MAPHARVKWQTGCTSLLYALWTLPDLSDGSTEALHVDGVLYGPQSIQMDGPFWLYDNLSQQVVLRASWHTFIWCHKHGAACLQQSSAAPKALYNMSNQAGLQSGLVAFGVVWFTQPIERNFLSSVQ